MFSLKTRLSLAMLVSASCLPVADSTLDGKVLCTFEKREALHVRIAGGRSVTSVTATVNSTTIECRETSFYSDAGLTYVCLEAGTGLHVVQVVDGDKKWNREADVGGDDCHVAQPPKVVTFDLDLQAPISEE